MPINFAEKSLDNVDASLKTHYEKGDDGVFYLNVTGAVAKSRLDEFRDNNVALSERLTKFKDVNLDEYNKLKTDALAGTKYTDDDVTTMVEDRVKSMKTQFEADKVTSDGQLSIATAQLETLLVDSAIRRAATAAGVIPTAADDVVLRAKSIYKIEEGVAVPYDADGRTIYGKNGTSPMPPSEWVKSLKKTASHLFIASKGGGSVTSSLTADQLSKLSPLQKITAGLDANK